MELISTPRVAGGARHGRARFHLVPCGWLRPRARPTCGQLGERSRRCGRARSSRGPGQRVWDPGGLAGGGPCISCQGTRLGRNREAPSHSRSPAERAPRAVTELNIQPPPSQSRLQGRGSSKLLQAGLPVRHKTSGVGGAKCRLPSPAQPDVCVCGSPALVPEPSVGDWFPPGPLHGEWASARGD